MTYGMQLLTALLVLITGWWLVGKLVQLLDKGLQKSHAEATLSQFLHNVLSIFLKGLVLIIFASMVGVETASLIALLGATGLAVGLALQGSLANFAGGVLILIFKPFKVGDEIESDSYRGFVREIQIFNTILVTRDNQRIIIPNSILSNGCVRNLFCEPVRRVDMTFGISYEDDILKAKKIIASELAKDPRILKEPAADILISAHADSSINIARASLVQVTRLLPRVFCSTREPEAGIRPRGNHDSVSAARRTYQGEFKRRLSVAAKPAGLIQGGTAVIYQPCRAREHGAQNGYFRIV